MWHARLHEIILHLQSLEWELHQSLQFTLEVFIGVLEPFQMEHQYARCHVYLHRLEGLTTHIKAIKYT